jgi:hypothetical protein
MFEAADFLHAVADVNSDRAWDIIRRYAAGPPGNRRSEAVRLLAER